MTPPSYVAATATRQYLQQQQQQHHSPAGVQQQLIRQQFKPPPPPPSQQQHRQSPYGHQQQYAPPRQPYRPSLGSAGYSQGTNPSTPSPVGVGAPGPPAMRLAGSSSASSSATSLQHQLASKQMNDSTRVYSVNNNLRPMHGLPVKNGNYQSPYQQPGEPNGMATLDAMWQQSQQMRLQNESYLPVS